MKLKFFFVCFVFIFLADFFSLFKLFRNTALQDFSVYTTAAQDIKNFRNPYTNPSNNYVYPPSSFFMLLPLMLLPYEIALGIWNILSVTALFFSLFFFLRSGNARQSFFKAFLFLTFALFAFPIKFNLGMGQVNTFVLFFVILSVFFSGKSKDTLSGVFLGLAAAIKIFPLFFLIIFIQQKKWRSVITCMLTFLTLNLLPVLFWGNKILQSFYAGELWTLGDLKNADYYNQALSGFLSRLHISPTLSSLLILFFLLIGLGVSWKRSRNFKNLQMWSIFICLWLLFQNVAWQHYFVFLTIPVVFLANEFFFEQEVPRWKKLLLLLMYVLSASNIRGTPHFGILDPFVYSHLFFATLGTYFLLLFAVAKEEKKV